MPARRLRPVGSSMNPGVKIGELALEILAVFLPCHAVDTGRRIPLQPRVGAVKKLDIDMVEERGEPFLPIQPCSCPYTARSGQTRDLPVPGQGAYAHAGVYDRAGPSSVKRQGTGPPHRHPIGTPFRRWFRLVPVEKRRGPRGA